MENWMDLPWWLRMIASFIVMTIGGGLIYLTATGQIDMGTRRRGPLGFAVIVTLAGVIMFATSFPYDRNKYNF